MKANSLQVACRSVSSPPPSTKKRQASIPDSQAPPTQQKSGGETGTGSVLRRQARDRRAQNLETIIRRNPVLPLPATKKKHVLLESLYKPCALVFSSAYLLETICELSAVQARSDWLPAAVGGGIGLGFVALNRLCVQKYWQEPSSPLNIVITGSTSGIGKAAARAFLRKGDRVMISSRNPSNVRQAIKELRDEVGSDAGLHGIECNVSSPGAVQRLAKAAESQMGSIDVWINNAGCSGRYQDFCNSPPEQLQAVVQTNLTGTLLGTRAALRCMQRQPTGGHIFNIDGAGADGLPTPQYTAYGTTKAGEVTEFNVVMKEEERCDAGIAHLMSSLVHEQKLKAAKCRNTRKADPGAKIGIHTLSPGMVLTPLLLEGANDRKKAVFNILCEQPETVAAFLAPRVRSIAAKGRKGQYIRFLTLQTALWRFLKAPLVANRFFSKQGEALYLDERQRILNPSQAKKTGRLASNAARQDKNLALAYSLSVTASFAIFVADAQGWFF